MHKAKKNTALKTGLTVYTSVITAPMNWENALNFFMSQITTSASWGCS